MNAARKTWVYLLTAALIVSGVALIAMMVIIVGNSLGRAIFNRPIWFTLDGGGLLGSIVVTGAVVYAARERVNIVIRFLFDRLSAKNRTIFLMVTLVISLGSVAFLTWAMFSSTIEAIATNERTVSTAITLWPFKAFFTFGLLLLDGLLIKHLAENVWKLVRR
jgi:TRAP-type C4-dicarboxylate transport system permease small subunit